MTPDLAMTYCRMIAQTLALDDIGTRRLLLGTGIDTGSLHNSDAFVGWPSAKTLIRNALALSPSPDLALRTGLRALPAMHGPMGMAAMASATVRDATHLFARFTNTRTRVFSVAVEEDAHTMTLRLDFAYPGDDAVRFLSEAALASAFACHLVLRGHAIKDGAVHFNYSAPPHAALYRKAFDGVAVHFNAPAVALTLPARYGDEPLPSHDHQLLQLAIQQCEVRQDALRHRGSLSEQVLALLQRSNIPPDLQTVAAALHISPRTLIRRLKQENTRFQQLRDQTLSRRAAQLLAQPHCTVAAAAEALGYADCASFRRAFHRWYGVSPGQFRP